MAGSQRIATPLRVEGHRVTVATDREQLLRDARSRWFDAVLLDVEDAGAGAALASELRASGMEAPILILSASGEPSPSLPLHTEHLFVPFEMAELIARLRVVDAHADPRKIERERYQFGDVCVDVGGTEILKRGRRVSVSAREFELLTYLLRHAGETISRERLLMDVWGYRETVATRTIDVHVATLRRKIELNPKSPRHLLTVKGFGYKFAAHVRAEEIHLDRVMLRSAEHPS